MFHAVSEWFRPIGIILFLRSYYAMYLNTSGNVGLMLRYAAACFAYPYEFTRDAAAVDDAAADDADADAHDDAARIANSLSPRPVLRAEAALDGAPMLE